MASKQIGSIRKDYGIGELSKENVSSNPIVQFESWFKEAYEREGDEANATTLSTIGLDGHPEGRIVLLKFYSEDGFAFYTNYNSMKGQELENHAYASLTFHWKTLERQVRIRGTVEKTNPIIDCCAVWVSISAPTPTVAMATLPSTPASQPLLFWNCFSAASVMKRITWDFI